MRSRRLASTPFASRSPPSRTSRRTTSTFTARWRRTARPRCGCSPSSGRRRGRQRGRRVRRTARHDASLARDDRVAHAARAIIAVTRAVIDARGFARQLAPRGQVDRSRARWSASTTSTTCWSRSGSSKRSAIPADAARALEGAPAVPGRLERCDGPATTFWSSSTTRTRRTPCCACSRPCAR